MSTDFLLIMKKQQKFTFTIYRIIPTAEDIEGDNLEPAASAAEDEASEPPIPRTWSKSLIKPPAKLLENCAVNFNELKTSFV